MGAVATRDKIGGQNARDLKRAREAGVLVLMRDGSVQPLQAAYGEMRRLMRKAGLRYDPTTGENVAALDKEGKPKEIEESVAREMREVMFQLIGYTAPKLLAAKIDGAGFEGGAGMAGGGARVLFLLPRSPREIRQPEKVVGSGTAVVESVPGSPREVRRKVVIA